MSDHKPFYEIQVPKKETEYAIHLVEISHDEGWTCMHTIFANKRRKRCPCQADDTCEFCGLWTCSIHFDYKQHIWIEDYSGFGNNGLSGYHASPCEQCARLPKEDMLKLRQLRLEINQ